jgi:HK97 family phage major capsid protein
MIDLESAVASNNADIGNMGYLTNAKVRGRLKSTLKAANVAGYIWEGSEVNGYKAAVTNSVPSNLSKGSTTGVDVCSAIIFGDWSKLIIGTWGGLDIVVDNYTLAAQSEVRFIINTYADAQVVNAKSFSVMKDVLTA